MFVKHVIKSLIIHYSRIYDVLSRQIKIIINNLLSYIIGVKELYN
jgi:hypothetical protein